MKRRGEIIRNERGFTIKPAVWSEPLAAPSPASRLEVGRVVRVTFDFVVETAGTREEIEEFVNDGLNGQFDTLAEPTLLDLGLRTDRPELLAEALGYK